jgi:hypothetical protein
MVNTTKRIGVDEYNARFALKVQDGRGRKRQAIGARNEDYVDALNRECELGRVAKLVKRPTLTRMVRGKQVFVKPAGVDYHGHMIGSGKAVYVETKRVSSGPFELRDLRVSQIAELANAWAGGALAFVLVIHGPKKVPCVIPWNFIRRELEAGTKSIWVDALLDFQAWPGVPYLAPWASK